MKILKSLIKKIDRFVPLKETAVSLLVCSIALILVEFIWDGSVSGLLNMNHLLVAVILLAYLIAVAVMIRYISRFLRIRRRNLGRLRDRVLEEQEGRGDTARIVMKAVLLMLIMLPIIMLTLISVETLWKGSVSYHINLNALIISTIAAELIAIIAVTVMLYRSRLRTGRPKPRKPAPRPLAPEIRAERAAAGLSTPDVAPAETMAGHGKRGWAGRIARVAPMVLFVILLLLVILQSFLNFEFLESSLPGMTIVTIVCGIIVFRIYRKKLKITPLKEKEEGEADRRKEFRNKFPRINTIPVIGWFIRWMYKEGWAYSACLVIVVVISMSFMLTGLNEFITRDEPRWLNWTGTGITPPTSLTESNDWNFVNSYYGRPVGYWDSYFSGNLEGTLVIDSGSGVTTSFLHFPAYFFQGSSTDLYLFLSRFPFVCVTIGAILMLYLLAKKLFSRKSALILSIIFGLHPVIIGFSRIVNHDSINGTLIIIFFLALLAAIRYNNSKYYLLSGLFYTLAVLTSGKAGFVTILLFVAPFLIYFYCKDIEFKNFFKGLTYFFSISTLIFLVLLPASIIYPQLIFTKLFLPQKEFLIVILPALVLLLVSIKYVKIINYIKKVLLKYSPILVRGLILLVFSVLIYIYVKRESIIETYLWERHDLWGAIQGTLAYFLFAIPTILLLILIIELALDFRKPRIILSQSFLLIFFVCLLSSVYFSQNASGFFPVYTKYQLLFVPFLLVYLSNSRILTDLKKIKFVLASFMLVIIMTIPNILFSPNQLFYTNPLYNSKYVLYPYSWGIGSYEAADYLNDIAQNADITVSDPYGHLSRFLNKNISRVSAVNAEYIVLHHFVPSHSNYQSLLSVFSESYEGTTEYELVWEYKMIKYAPLVQLYKRN